MAPDAAHPPIDLDVRHGTFELAGQQAQLRRKARHTDAGLGSDSRTKTIGESGDPGLRSTRAADGRPLTGSGRRPPARHRPRGPGVGTFDDGEHGLALGVEVRPQQGLKLLVHVLAGGVVHAVVMAAAARRSTPPVNAYRRLAVTDVLKARGRAQDDSATIGCDGEGRDVNEASVLLLVAPREIATGQMRLLDPIVCADRAGPHATPRGDVLDHQPRELFATVGEPDADRALRRLLAAGPHVDAHASGRRGVPQGRGQRSPEPAPDLHTSARSQRQPQRLARAASHRRRPLQRALIPPIL